MYGPYYVDNAVDYHGFWYPGLWAVWYKDTDGERKQATSEPYFSKFFAQLEANRFNKRWLSRNRPTV